MSQLYLILRELRDNGPATSRELADAISLPAKRVSTLLGRMAGYRMVMRGRVIRNPNGRPSFLWVLLE